MTSAADRAVRRPLRPAHGPASAARAWRWLPFVVAVLLVGLQIAAILARNGGRLTYSLDDPYIHLAVSESIARGHYGIEPREPSAPSSSILWPFLLAPGAALPGHELLPLALNLAALFAALGVLARLLRRCRLHRAAGGEAFAAGLLSILVLTLNLTGLALTGMEHSLQVVLALVVVLGMIDVGRGRPAPPWLLGAIVAGPLVRYESAALSVAAVLLLLIRERWRAASLAVAACLSLVGLFSLFLVGLGLEPLPGPVLENLEVTGGGPAGGGPALLMHVWVRLKWILGMVPARILASLTGVLMAVALASRRRDAELLLCGAVAPLLHLGFGSFGGFARYEIYVLASVVAFLIYGLRRPLRRLVTTRGATAGLLAAGAVLMPALSGYAAIAYLTPRAAHNIHVQHGQLHRFVTEHYRRPVAVNDLGRVSYRNPSHVLDLWGLCSMEVRRARLDGDPAWPSAFVARDGVDLAMIYDTWFEGRVPAGWRRVARLELLGKRVTPASSTVSFYVSQPGGGGEIDQKLRVFRDTLPVDVALEVEPGGSVIGPGDPREGGPGNLLQ